MYFPASLFNILQWLRSTAQPYCIVKFVVARRRLPSLWYALLPAYALDQRTFYSSMLYGLCWPFLLEQPFFLSSIGMTTYDLSPIRIYLYFFYMWLVHCTSLSKTVPPSWILLVRQREVSFSCISSMLGGYLACSMLNCFILYLGGWWVAGFLGASCCKGIRYLQYWLMA